MPTNKNGATAPTVSPTQQPGQTAKQDHSTPFTPTPQAIQGNSAEAQRQRLLTAIKERGSISTLEARKPDLDIMAPAARIMELRKKGEPIETVRVPEVSPAGKVHNVARYVFTVQDVEAIHHD